MIQKTRQLTIAMIASNFTRRSAVLSPESSADLAFTQMEMAILDHVVPGSAKQKQRQPGLALYVNRLARLGGYLDRSCDPTPGNMVMWRGLTRLNDIALRIRIAANFVGN